MRKYHKIQSMFKRHEKSKKFLKDEYTTEEFEFLRGCEWNWSEKLDGTNIRIGWDGNGEYRYGGRTDEAQIPVMLLNSLQDTLPEHKVKALVKSGAEYMTLYGEGVGYKIQKGGGYNPDGHEFILFDVRVGDFWLKRHDVMGIADQLGVRFAPTIGVGTLEEAVDYVAKGFDSRCGDCKAEGLILRPQVEVRGRNGDRIITKLKSKDFVRGWHEPE